MRSSGRQGREFAHRFRAGMDLEFLVDTPDVSGHRAGADAQRRDNFFVLTPAREELQDLALPI